jgi:hypothetical protein
MTEQPARPTFATWMGSMWLYTLLRFGMFFALWGLIVLAGMQALFAAVLAAALSLPLSYVLLARPRAHFAATIEQRVQAHQAQRERLDERLSGDET